MSLEDVTQAGRQRIRHVEDRADGAIRAAYHSHYGRISERLSRLLGDASDAIANGETISILWLHQHGIRDIQAFTHNEIAAFTATARDIATQSMREAVIYGAGTAFEQLQVGLPTDIAIQLNRPNEEAMRNIIEGQRIEQYFGDMPDAAKERLTDILYSGLAGGQNPKVVARELAQGLGMPLNKALTIARTETMTAYRSANLASYQANSDVVDGWIWLAADGCCAFCADMNGSRHTNDEDMETHPNCRCAMQPFTKSYDDILSQLDAIGGDDTSGDDMELDL